MKYVSAETATFETVEAALDAATSAALRNAPAVLTHQRRGQIKKDEYKACSDAGMTVAQAARHLNVTYGRVYNAKLRFGLEFGVPS